VRWQWRTNKVGLISFASNIVRSEGIWRGLWKPGLTANVCGMSGAAAIRLGYYETVRDSLSSIGTSNSANHRNTSSHPKTGVTMFMAGLVCGSVAFLATAPFHFLKTVIQADLQKQVSALPHNQKPLVVQDLTTGAIRILKENKGNIFSLWKGVIPLTCRGALFTSGQMMGYDGVKTIFKQHRQQDGIAAFFFLEDSPALHVLASISASFGASFLSTPADYVMAKYMATKAIPSSSSSSSLLRQCIQDVYKKEGILGFWKGWSIYFIQLTPLMICASTLYEQTRLIFGLGYMS